jgi:hypothetical protein
MHVQGNCEGGSILGYLQSIENKSSIADKAANLESVAYMIMKIVHRMNRYSN